MNHPPTYPEVGEKPRVYFLVTEEERDQVHLSTGRIKEESDVSHSDRVCEQRWEVLRSSSQPQVAFKTSSKVLSTTELAVDNGHDRQARSKTAAASYGLLMKYKVMECRKAPQEDDTKEWYMFSPSDELVIRKVKPRSEEFLRNVLSAMTPPYQWLNETYIFRYKHAVYVDRDGLFLIGDDYHDVVPGHVRVSPDGRIQHTEEYHALTDSEAKVVLWQLLEGLFFLQQAWYWFPMFPMNVVISKGRIKFIVGRPNIDYCWGYNSVPLVALGVTENRFQASRYRPPFGNDGLLHEWLTTCVLFVFELMTGGIPAYDVPNPGLRSYDIFVTNRFLSTQPRLEEWEDVIRGVNPASDLYRAAERVRGMSQGMLQIFEATLFYEPQHRWSIHNVFEWLNTISNMDPEQALPDPVRLSLPENHTVEESPEPLRRSPMSDRHEPLDAIQPSNQDTGSPVQPAGDLRSSPEDLVNFMEGLF